MNLPESCRPVRTTPSAEIGECIPSGKDIVVGRGERRLLGVGELAADDCDHARIGSVVPPGKHRTARITVVQVAILRFQLISSASVTHVPVTLETNGIFGGLGAVSFTACAKASTTGSIIGE